MQLIQGQYDRAMDNVQQNVDDWKIMQDLKLQVLEEEGQIEKEEKARYEQEIEYERGLGEQGYVHVDSTEAYNQVVKDLGVTADTYSNFFYKDPGTGKIYLKPSDVLSIAEAKSLGVPYGTTKQEAIDMGITPKTTGGGGGGTTNAFKFSSDDTGRLLNVGFTSADAKQIQSDINEFGVDVTVADMPENQAKAIRDIASGVTPTQAIGEPTAAEREIIGGIRALMLPNDTKANKSKGIEAGDGSSATIDELKEYIELSGYEPKDYEYLWKDYKPTLAPVKRTFWQTVLPGGK